MGSDTGVSVGAGGGTGVGVGEGVGVGTMVGAASGVAVGQRRSSRALSGGAKTLEATARGSAATGEALPAQATMSRQRHQQAQRMTAAAGSRDIDESLDTHRYTFAACNPNNREGRALLQPDAASRSKTSDHPARRRRLRAGIRDIGESLDG